MKPTRIFIDTEFMDDGKTIELISLGACFDMKCGTIGKFYVCNQDADLSKANGWVKEHVLPQLPPKNHHSWLPYKEIADRFEQFCNIEPEFWGYFSAYDWVAICQMYGAMVDLPEGWPMYCNDLRQWANMLGINHLPQQESGEHSAINDAMWNRSTWLWLKEQEEK